MSGVRLCEWRNLRGKCGNSHVFLSSWLCRKALPVSTDLSLVHILDLFCVGNLLKTHISLPLSLPHFGCENICLFLYYITSSKEQVIHFHDYSTVTGILSIVFKFFVLNSNIVDNKAQSLDLHVKVQYLGYGNSCICLVL